MHRFVVSCLALTLCFLSGGCESEQEPLVESRDEFVNQSIDEQIASIDDVTKLDDRIDRLSKEIAEQPTAKGHLQRGAVWTLKRDYAKAMADFDQAIEIDPDYATAYYNRGCIHAQLGDDDQAIAEFTAAIDADPSYHLAYSNRGICLLEQSDYDAAHDDLSRAVELKPDNHVATHALAIVYFDRPNRSESDLAESLELVTRACELTDYEDDEYLVTREAIKSELAND